MFKLAKPFFIICETPMHCGSGNDIGIVDLPIQRERHTDFPKIEGSSLKGGIREAFEERDEEIDVGATKIKASDKDTISLAFGPDVGSDHAGALGFSDARLLLFPVKSMKGVFAWVTCPKILERFRNDFKLCESDLNLELPKENTAPNECALFIKNNNIVLEEYTFEITKDSDVNGNCTKLASWFSTNLFTAGGSHQFWIDKIKKDIVVLSNDDFRDFVTLSTEVITRTKINNNTGTVQSGALFTEEYLPTETILYSLALTTPVFKKEEKDKGVFKKNGGKEGEDLVMEFFTNGLPEIIQLGGNATIGKGIVRTKVWGVKNG
mgnify:CR=1 FL=1